MPVLLALWWLFLEGDCTVSRSNGKPKVEISMTQSPSAMSRLSVNEDNGPRKAVMFCRKSTQVWPVLAQTTQLLSPFGRIHVELIDWHVSHARSFKNRMKAPCSCTFGGMIAECCPTREAAKL